MLPIETNDSSDREQEKNRLVFAVETSMGILRLKVPSAFPFRHTFPHLLHNAWLILI